MNEKELKNLLKKCKVIDVDFGFYKGVVYRMTLETQDGKLLLVEAEPINYDGVTIGNCFGITDVKTRERLA